jgi:hypothetical protein
MSVKRMRSSFLLGVAALLISGLGGSEARGGEVRFQCRGVVVQCEASLATCYGDFSIYYRTGDTAREAREKIEAARLELESRLPANLVAQYYNLVTQSSMGTDVSRIRCRRISF